MTKARAVLALMATLTFAALAVARMSATVDGGVAISASSTGASIAASDANDRWPSTVR